jgi:hypothetical protein
MNISITDEEYRDLVDILHVSEWVITAHTAEERVPGKRHLALIQKLYALAGEAGLGHLVTRDRDAGKYFPAKEHESASPAHGFIDEFVEHAFWDELIYRMSERDAMRQAGGADGWNALAPGDRSAIEAPIERRYAEEFGRNGIENLAIVEPLGTGIARPKTSD